MDAIEPFVLYNGKGKIVLLEEVLNEAIQSAKEQISEKNPDLENKDVVAKQVGGTN